MRILPARWLSRRVGFAAILILLPITGRAAGEQPDQTPVVSVSLSLVQVDAVVTDRKGHYLNDIDCGEFQILEDGKQQEIANCSYVNTESIATPSLGTVSSATRRERVKRTIALVVDDWNLDLISINSVRAGLLKYVDGQIADGDLVALIRTTGGASRLQQFTTDKRVLRAAIDRLRFNPLASPDVFEAAGTISVLPRLNHGEGFEEFQNTIDDTMADAAISTLRFVLGGLREMPGRKSLVLFSSGYKTRTKKKFQTGFAKALPGLVDLANRGSVVIYCVDTAGVISGARTAADNINPALEPYDPNEWTSDRAGSARAKNGLDSIDDLSEFTGGLLLQGSNDMGVQLGKVIEDQAGYYLIGYVPAASSLSASGAPTFHKLQVKARRKGAKVRSRSGFYGVSDDDPRLKPSLPAVSLAQQLASPFGSTDVGLTLSSVFFNDPVRGNLLHSFLQVSLSDLTLTEEPDGGASTRAEIEALTLNADGQIVDELRRAGEVKLTATSRAAAAQYGLTYTIDVPLKAEGAYQLRVAFRDVGSGRVGSAFDFVDVPDLKKGNLALSGILMTHAVMNDQDPSSTASSEAFGSAASRSFSPGQSLLYAMTAYNARTGTEAKPRLRSQAKLILEDKVIAEVPPRLVETTGDTDPTRILLGGTLLLPTQMAEGEYQLVVTVEDLLGKGTGRMTRQASTFRIQPRKGTAQ